jgi:hypothetical protein
MTPEQIAEAKVKIGGTAFGTRPQADCVPGSGDGATVGAVYCDEVASICSVSSSIIPLKAGMPSPRAR